ncbi:TRAP transporter small permease subunit [Aliihoeflea aestuarii]|uniref:TRAP transporter small permease subunit n=1 Tax=Aliihoeflea aestuarii TaxID=453840 RepID=UPI0027E22586|nr:TRAP transporter small permease subunit [Aliihoeflea aestuarii]
MRTPCDGRRTPFEDKLMGLIVFLIRAIASFNRLLGNTFSWLSLVMVAVCFTVVVQRYVFGFSIIWMQDLYVWLNGAMFTAVAGYALLKDSHVRVDIFYRPASVQRKALIDLIGVVVFLIPFCWITYVYSWTYIARSWRISEGSANFGGMPGLYILKSFILVFAFVVFIQGVAMALRSILVLMGKEHLLPADLRYPVHQD